MKIKVRYLFALWLVAIGLFMVSCASVPSGEPAAQYDSNPPDGYSPSFFASIDTVPENMQPSEGRSVSILRAECTPARTTLYFHLIDSSGTYYSKALDYPDIFRWCWAAETFDSVEKPITDFKIREATEADEEKLAIAFVIDHSGSMGDWRAKGAQEAIAALAKNKRAEDALSVIKYDNRVSVEAPFSDNSDELLKNIKINSLEGFGGMTAILNAIRTGIESLDAAKQFERKAVVLITDGVDNSSTVKLDSLLAFARATNTSVSCLGFGDYIDEDFLKKIAVGTGGAYRKIFKTEEFGPAFKDIYKRYKNYYALEYTPEDYGPHKIKIKLCLPGDTLNAEYNFDNTPNVGAIDMINVYFDTDKSKIKEESKPAIDHICRLMSMFPTLEIDLRGHTDSTGELGHNTKLSLARANAVKNELVRCGISASRIECYGFGPAIPIATNETDAGRQKNRRTEFKIRKK